MLTELERDGGSEVQIDFPVRVLNSADAAFEKRIVIKLHVFVVLTVQRFTFRNIENN